ALVVEEEEGAIAAVVEARDADGPADVGAVVPLPIARAREAARVVGVGALGIEGTLEVVVVGVGVQRLVAEEEVALAVQLVAARLDREVDDAARALAKLGRVVRGRDGEL